MPPPAEQRRIHRIHPIVRLDYTVRVPAQALVGAASLVYFWDQGTPLLLAAGIAAFVLWPHAAYFRALRSVDQKRAELGNLMVDNFILGCWTAAASFTPWLAAAALCGIAPATFSVAGFRRMLRGLAMFALGAFLVGWANGFRVDLSATPLVTAICATGIFVFIVMFGGHSHVQSRIAINRWKQLQQQNATIEEQRRMLAEAATAAAAASEEKSRFLANMSHELRTPLNAIIGYSEMLIDEARDAEDGGTIADLEKIRGAGKHLLGLINDVLDLSKVEAGRMDLVFESFSVDDLVRDVLSTVWPLVERSGNTLEYAPAGELGTMCADATKLRQVLLNLLSNANKFTHEGTVILAAERSATPAGDTLRFAVCDTGIGMAPEQVARLFQPFVQVHEPGGQQYGGTGLGLAISQRFCVLMGGSIGVESAPGSGTTFTVLLPAQPRERVPATEGAAEQVEAPLAFPATA